MNPKMKRMIVEERRRRKDGTYMNYEEPYSERSGSRGVRRDGISYPIYPGMEFEATFRDRRGREHYDNGRYAPMRSAYDDDMEDAYPYPPIYPTVPPVYTGPERYVHHSREWPEDEGRPMNRIGFVMPEEDPARYGSRVNTPRMNEYEHHRSGMEKGWAHSMEVEPMTKDTAMEWVMQMKNADGTSGPHWTMEQTNQVMEQQHIDCDEVEFFVAINMMYSDYCKVAKRHNCSTMEFYAGMAKAFLEDKDAQPEKLSRYYECIVKH